MPDPAALPQPDGSPMSDRLRLWKADEDGCVQWWCVARDEEEARRVFRDFEVPSEDTQEFTVEPVPDDFVFTLTCTDDDWTGPLPEGAEVTPREDHPHRWQTVRATAAAFAAQYTEPGYFAGTEW